MSEKTRVLIVDDDVATCGLLKSILKELDFVHFVAHNGHDALDLALDKRPDFVILDLRLPGIGGLDVCRELRSWYQGPILILSGDSDNERVVQALEFGADDYITKPFHVSELRARVSALLRRANRHLAQETPSRHGMFEIDVVKRIFRKEGSPIRLTRTEFNILVVLMKNFDAVVSTHELLKQVWGPFAADYTTSLRVHIAHLRKKLEAEPASPRFLLTVLGYGYRLTCPSSTLESSSDSPRAAAV